MVTGTEKHAEFSSVGNRVASWCLRGFLHFSTWNLGAAKGSHHQEGVSKARCFAKSKSPHFPCPLEQVLPHHLCQDLSCELLECNRSKVTGKYKKWDLDRRRQSVACFSVKAGQPRPSGDGAGVWATVVGSMGTVATLLPSGLLPSPLRGLVAKIRQEVELRAGSALEYTERIYLENTLGVGTSDWCNIALESKQT